MYRTFAVVLMLGCILVCAGCEKRTERLNAPPQGAAEVGHPLQEYYVYMQDNALLADMSISDVHFVPHTAELNGLGAQRLRRYVDLMEMYGGTLRLDTELSADDPLAKKRVEHTAEYLRLSGLDPDRFDVVIGAPGGRGMQADEAIRALDAAQSECGDSGTADMTMGAPI